MVQVIPALRALRPIEAALVSAPAPAGWLWAGGAALELRVGVAAALGSWLIGLAAFAWNDRADGVLGLARFHRLDAVRALHDDPSARRGLAVLGWMAAALGLACWSVAGPRPLGVATVVAASAWLYSSPVVFGKGRPVAASALHLVGGAANGLAGAIAAVSWPTALVWGATFGALFTAAHGVHQVAGRDEDRAADVGTSASRRPLAAAARAALALLLAALVVPVAGGLAIRDVRGMAMVLAASWMIAWIAVLSSRALTDREAWARFQRRCRLVVASGVVIGLGYLLGVAPPQGAPDELDAALSCLEREQRADGTWPTFVRWQADGEWTEVYSVFTTAQVLLALSSLPRDARVEALASPALDTLEADRNDDGTWSFYGRADRVGERPGRAWDITADADDTARVALALAAWGRPVPVETVDALATLVSPDGVVATWFAPPHLQKLTDSNRPDPVIAAVVARVLEGAGRDGEVQRIHAHLNTIRGDGGPEETTYYVGSAVIGHEIALALGEAAPGDTPPGWPADEPRADGCWPLQPTFHGAAEAGRPAYGSVAEPTAAGAVARLRGQR